MALARGKVFAHNCAKDLTLSQLKTAMQDGDNRIFKKLMHFTSPIPGTMQYMRHQSDLCHSFLKWLRISSGDTEMFNAFLTFSAADLHWPDLHKILDQGHDYIHKTPTDEVSAKDPQEQHKFIDSTEDFMLRQRNIRDNEDMVGWYFVQRVKALFKHVLPELGMTEFIYRLESQQRGKVSSCCSSENMF